MRRRILAAIVGVATVAVMLFAIPLGVTVRNLTIQDELNEIEHVAERVGHAVEPENVGGDNTHALQLASREIVVGIYDRNGRRVGGAGPVRLESGLRRSLRGEVTRLQGASLLVAVPIGVRPTTGVVLATVTATNVNSRVRRAWLFLAAFALLAILTAAVLAWWLSRQLDAPLLRLVAAAHRVGDGDFTSRTERSGVAEIDDVAAAIDTTAERLGAALDRERSFSGDVSHQLRTRVAGLRITLEAAAVTGTSEHEAIEQAIIETERLESTIAELLALARGTQTNHPPLDVPAMLDELQHAWRSRLSKSGRSFIVRSEPALSQPRVSSIAVLHVLDVLVDNAERHGRGEIRVNARATHDGVAIDVHDEGPGITIAPDDLFRRRAAGTDGHGIGLALARSLAEAEGGRLVLTGRTPGAKFTLLLPH